MKEEGNIGIGYDPTSSLLEMPTMRIPEGEESRRSLSPFSGQYRLVKCNSRSHGRARITRIELAVTLI